MSLHLRADRNNEFFSEFSHELAEVQSKYKDITLSYTKDLGFALEALSKGGTGEVQKNVVREYTKAADELLRLVHKKRWGVAEDDTHAIQRLEATLHTCQKLEELTQKLSKKFRSLFKTKTSPAADKQLKELHRIEQEFSKAKKEISTAALKALGVTEINDELVQDFENAPSLLHAALTKEHGDIALQLIRSGVDIHTPDQEGNTPLMLACDNGLEEAAKELLKRGVDIHKVNNKGMNALYYALLGKLNDISFDLITEGVDTHLVDDEGDSLLALACGNELPEVALQLIKRGADVNVVSHKNDVALSWAADNGLSEVAPLLAKLTSLENVQRVNSEGRSPLLYSLKRNLVHTTVELLKKGAPITDQCEQYMNNLASDDANGDTLLILACRKNDLAIAKKALDHKASPNAINKHGETALHVAAACNNCELIKELLPRGANLNVQNSNGETPLVQALREGKKEAALLLIQRGAHLGIQDKDGNTALHFACKNGHFEVVRALLENVKGEARFTQNIFQQTPFQQILVTPCWQTHPQEMTHILKEVLKGYLPDNDIEKMAVDVAQNKAEGFRRYILANAAQLTDQKENKQKIQKLFQIALLFQDPPLLKEFGKEFHVDQYFAAVHSIVKDMPESCANAFVDRLNIEEKPLKDTIQKLAATFEHIAIFDLVDFYGSKSQELRSEIEKTITVLKEKYLAQIGHHKNMPEYIAKGMVNSFINEVRKEIVEVCVPFAVKRRCDSMLQILLDEPYELQGTYDRDASLLRLSKKEGIGKESVEGEDEEEVEKTIHMAAHCCTILNSLEKASIEKLQKTLLSCEPDQFLPVLRREAEQLKQESATLRQYDDAHGHFEKSAAANHPELRGFREDDLYLSGGVCMGACLDVAAKKLSGNQPEALILPSRRARFLQACHDLHCDFERGYFAGFVKKQKGVLKTAVSIEERCTIRYDLLIKMAEFLGDKKLKAEYQKGLKELHRQNNGKLQALSIKLAKEITRLDGIIGEVEGEIDDAFLKKLHISLGKDLLGKSLKIDDFVLHLETYVNKLLVGGKGGHVLLSLKDEGDPIYHAVYCHLEPPYEFQDVNAPLFSFKTNDINTFKLYLAKYFIEHDYSKVSAILQVTKR